MLEHAVNIELLGCPKYKDLLLEYNTKQECCVYHLNNTFHCSGHEVKMFA